MADDELEPGKPVEHTAGDDPQQVEARLDTEPEDRAVQAGLEERPDHRPRWRVGVQVDGSAEGLARLEDRPEVLVVEVLALGVRVHDHAPGTQGVPTVDLLGGLVGMLRCDGGESGEPIRVGLAGLGEPVVGKLGHRHRLARGQYLGAGRRQGDDLSVDPVASMSAIRCLPRSVRRSAMNRGRSASEVR